MRFSKSYFAAASFLLASTLVWGQHSQNDQRTSLLVRMSFTNSWVTQGLGRFPQICFSVDRDGHYEMRRLTMKSSSESPQASPDDKSLPGTPYTELLQGTLSAGELEQLEKLLADPEFLKLAASAPNILRSGAETFVAEVPRDDYVQRVVMSDADGENPFPRSANRIVNWLQHFKAEGAKPLDVSAEDICPRGSLQPVKPSTALLQPMPTSGACAGR
jgi:hypothetical protein